MPPAHDSDPNRGLRPAAVLWDMDGTLVDTEPLWTVALADLAAHLGGRLSTQTRAAMVGTDMPATLAMMFDDVRLVPQPAQLSSAGEWLTRRTGELFADGIPWRPGAAGALAAVHASGLPAALVTSTGRELTELVLDTIGRHRFRAMVCGDEVRYTKPHPEPYRRAAELLGVAPQDCVAIEDSPSGAAAAEAAGCLVLVVPSEVPVPAGPRRVHRASLAGLTAAELGRLAEPPRRMVLADR